MEVDVLLLFELFDSVQADLALVLHVYFVAYQEQDYVGLALIHYFVVPRVQVVECLKPGDIVRQEDTVGSSVKYLGDAFERFLAGGVPDLEFKDLAFQLDEEGSELDTDCDFVISQELVVGQPMQQTRLADSRVAYYNQFEQEVLVLHAFVLQDLVWHLLQTLS